MKRTYLPRHSIFVSTADLSWGGVVVVVACLVFVLRFVAPNFFWHVTAPFFNVSSAVAEKTHAVFGGFGNTAELTLAHERLTRDNAALTLENTALRANLVQIAGLGTADLGIVAGVIARPPQSPYDTLVLAKGTEAGVMVGMQVFGEGSVPLGVVQSVSNDFARVLLYSAPGVRTAGWVGNNLAITLEGAGGGALHGLLSRSAGVTVGDTVFVPGPGLLAIGVVSGIDDDPSSPAIALRIVPALNPFSVAWVTVRATGVGTASAFFTASTTPP